MLHNKTVISVFSLSVEKKIGKKGVSLDYVILTKIYRGVISFFG